MSIVITVYCIVSLVQLCMHFINRTDHQIIRWKVEGGSSTLVHIIDAPLIHLPKQPRQVSHDYIMYVRNMYQASIYTWTDQ